MGYHARVSLSHPSYLSHAHSQTLLTRGRHAQVVTVSSYAWDIRIPGVADMDEAEVPGSQGGTSIRR